MIKLIETEEDRQYVIQYIKGIKLGKKPYLCEIKKKVERRTIDQNKLLRLWYACIIQETGNTHLTTDDIHEYFLEKYAPRIEKSVFDENKQMMKRSSEMTTKEFAEFMLKIETDPVCDGMMLPKPPDKHFIEFYETYKGYMR